MTGVSRMTVWKAAKRDAQFAQAMAEAREVGTERLEDALWERAVNGVLRTTYDGQGNVISEQRVYSDRAAIFLLKGRAPEKYRENHHVGKEKVSTLDDLVALALSFKEGSVPCPRVLKGPRPRERLPNPICAKP